MTGFRNLHSLDVTAAKVAEGPELDGLKNLRKLQLSGMKTWRNPEVISDLPALRTLALHDINRKLPAESFFFLTEMKTLREVDFLFIDYNKQRIRALRDWFLSQGKPNLFPKDAITEKVFKLCD